MKTYLSLSHPQKRIWYIEKKYPNTSINNIGGSVRIKGTVDFKALEKSINMLIEKNDALRLKFIEQDGEPKQYVACYDKIHLQYFDFSVYENPEQIFNKWVQEEMGRPLFENNKWLFHFALFKISPSDKGYIAKFHHMICDGWSIHLMTEQICDYYTSLTHGTKVDEEKKDSYITYLENEKKYLFSNRFLKNRIFWIERFANITNSLENSNSIETKGKRKTFTLETDITKKIKEFLLF